MIALFLAATFSTPNIPKALASISAGSSPSERVARASTLFLDAPYLLGPLGEGAPPDADPLLRYDVFDCVTLVETALALANAPSADAVLPVMTDIRYAAPPPRFGARNHFTEAQWIPQNVKKGYLHALAFPDAVPATRLFDHATWASGGGNLGGVALAEADYPTGTFSVPMVPLARARAAFGRVPSGSIVLIVRADQRDKLTRISHMGVVIAKNHQVFVRNASSKFGRVIDETVDAFLARNAAFKAWPVDGFAFYEPLDARARAAQLVR